MLSEYLAERVRHVHVIEIDERLSEALLDATAGFANTTVHWGDVTEDRAVRAQCRRQRWSPICPTGRRRCAPAAHGSSSCRSSSSGWRWSSARSASAWPPGRRVLGAREAIRRLRRAVGDRAARLRGSKCCGGPAHGVPSGAERRLGARRLAPPRAGRRRALRGLVNGAFAHRRKTLAGSLALSGRDVGHSREQVREALEQLEVTPPTARRASVPEDFRALARLLSL